MWKARRHVDDEEEGEEEKKSPRLRGQWAVKLGLRRETASIHGRYSLLFLLAHQRAVHHIPLPAQTM